MKFAVMKFAQGENCTSFAKWGQRPHIGAFKFAVSRTKPIHTTPPNFNSSIDFTILRIEISNSRSKPEGLDF